MRTTLLTTGLLAILVWTSFAWVSTRFRTATHVLPGGEYAVRVREAPLVTLPPVLGSPLGTDCNNPMFWDGGTLYCFVSHDHPFRSEGPSLAELKRPSRRVSIDNEAGWTDGGRWIEAIHKAPSGRLYAWYHNEPHGRFPGHPNGYITAPRIGQMSSDDNGLHWHDQGLILEAPANSYNTETVNLYFTGGNGDFTVLPDPREEHLYFFLSTYNKDVHEQGVSLARLAVSDLEDPVGKVAKWYEGDWREPGLGGHVTPIFAAERDWHSEGTRVFWGPAIHWNTHLQMYVMVMNLSIDPRFGQGGIFLSLNPRLDDPEGWTEPTKILDVKEWYPQVVGTSVAGLETDRLAGRVARLFVKGQSSWEIEFEKLPR